jgi:hypothetical protein
VPTLLEAGLKVFLFLLSCGLLTPCDGGPWIVGTLHQRL